MPTIPAVLTIIVALAGLLVPALLSVVPVLKISVFRPNKRSDVLHSLTSWYFWISFRQILQNGVEAITVASPYSNSSHSTAATRLFTDIVVALDILSFIEHITTQQPRDSGGEKRLTIIARRPLGCPLRLFSSVIRRSSFLMVFGFTSLLDLYFQDR